MSFTCDIKFSTKIGTKTIKALQEYMYEQIDAFIEAENEKRTRPFRGDPFPFRITETGLVLQNGKWTAIAMTSFQSFHTLLLNRLRQILVDSEVTTNGTVGNLKLNEYIVVSNGVCKRSSATDVQNHSDSEDDDDASEPSDEDDSDDDDSNGDDEVNEDNEDIEDD